jgi:hypothetical protein
MRGRYAVEVGLTGPRLQVVARGDAPHEAPVEGNDA